MLLLVVIFLMTSYGCSLVGLCHPKTACEHDPKVSVEVFYETYCPDSRNFVLEELNGTYAELSDIIQLQLVPYGKASRRELPNKWFTFDCQHGDKECYGNLLQTCVIKYYPEPSQHLPLVVCMFSSKNPNRAYDSCARKQGFDIETLQKCVSGKEGNDLQLRFAEWTESVNGKGRLEFVPWIRMNGKDKMYDAFNNFKKTLCEEYKSMIDTLCTGDSPRTQPIELPQACKLALS
ncbi:gamma-interferon-inducible lysosomal thiol reductase-like isoform X1 [Amblyomma americanum]